MLKYLTSRSDMVSYNNMYLKLYLMEFSRKSKFLIIKMFY